MLASAEADPSSIDKMLLPDLLDPNLATYLSRSICDLVDGCRSSDGLWDGAPFRPGTAYYNTLVQASLLGRAYALLAGQDVETDNPYLRDLEEDDYLGME